MGEPKVVESGPVEFGPSSARPDALPPSEPAVEQPEELPPGIHPDVHKALIHYLINIVEAVNTKRAMSMSEPVAWPHLLPLARYLRFQRDMSVSTAPVPRQTFLALIQRENADLATLLSTTDLWEELPDPCILDNPLPNVVESLGSQRELLVMKELRELRTVTQEDIVIPGRYFVSLLIQDGETYRRFLNHSGLDQKVTGYLSGIKTSPTVESIIHLVSPDKLAAFVQDTKELHVRGFLTDLRSLYDEIEESIRLGEPGSNPNRFLKILYSRLERYHPELTSG